MARRANLVTLSSKGQLVIPAALRRRLGLTTGQTLSVRSGNGREIVLLPAADEPVEVDAMLQRARSWCANADRDLVDELHARRRHERDRARGSR